MEKKTVNILVYLLFFGLIFLNLALDMHWIEIKHHTPLNFINKYKPWIAPVACALLLCYQTLAGKR